MKKHGFSALVLLMAALCIFGLFSACSSPQPTASPVTSPAASSAASPEASSPASPEASSLPPATYTMMTWNADDANQKYNADAIAAVEAAYPEVTIELQNLDGSDPAFTQIKTLIASKQVPDFYVVLPAYAAAMDASGQLADLTPVADKIGLTSAMSPMSQHIATYNGKIVAVPAMAMSCSMIYYNIQIFADNGITAPQTWDEFVAACEKLRAAGIDPISVAGKEKIAYLLLLDIFATRDDYMAAQEMIDGTLKFTDEPYMQAAQKLQQLAQIGAFSKDANIKDSATAEADFTSGKSGMLVEPSYAFSSIGDKMGYDKFSYLYFPANDAAQYDDSKVHWSGGDAPPVGFAMNPNSFKTPEEFERAANILMIYGQTVCDDIAKMGNPVVSLKTDVTPDVPYPPVILQWEQDFANIQTSPPYLAVNCPPQASSAFADGVQKLATGEYDPAQFCKDMQQAFDDAR